MKFLRVCYIFKCIYFSVYALTKSNPLLLKIRSFRFEQNFFSITNAGVVWWMKKLNYWSWSVVLNKSRTSVSPHWNISDDTDNLVSLVYVGTVGKILLPTEPLRGATYEFFLTSSSILHKRVSRSSRLVFSGNFP